MTASLFISYRRAGTGGHAGRLYDRLHHWFDDNVLFYDLDGIDIGDIFSARIETAITAASVVPIFTMPASGKNSPPPGPNWTTKNEPSAIIAPPSPLRMVD